MVYSCKCLQRPHRASVAANPHFLNLTFDWPTKSVRIKIELWLDRLQINCKLTESDEYAPSVSTNFGKVRHIFTNVGSEVQNSFDEFLGRQQTLLTGIEGLVDELRGWQRKLSLEGIVTGEELVSGESSGPESAELPGRDRCKLLHEKSWRAIIQTRRGPSPYGFHHKRDPDKGSFRSKGSPQKQKRSRNDPWRIRTSGRVSFNVDGTTQKVVQTFVRRTKYPRCISPSVTAQLHDKRGSLSENSPLGSRETTRLRPPRSSRFQQTARAYVQRPDCERPRCE